MKRAVMAVVILSAVVFFGFAEMASAQCAMCRTALEQDGGRLALGFNRAILFLLAMPYLVFASVAGSWYWKRRKAGRLRGAPASPAEGRRA
ncbi:MAG: hypothetical protein ACRD21_12935 [Vicinamibacteria bacterium]